MRRAVLPADPLDELRATVAALAARIATLEAQRLRRGRGPRDLADARVMEALADLLQGGEFRTADVLERGELDSDFKALLERPDVVTTSVSATCFVDAGRRASTVGA